MELRQKTIYIKEKYVMREKIRKYSVASSFLIVLVAFAFLKGTPGNGRAAEIIKLTLLSAAIRMVNKMPLPQRGRWKGT